MKLPLAPAHLATRFHRPLRFGSRWRGHELPLRLAQLLLIVLIASVGVKWLARGLTWVTQNLAQVVT